MQYSVQEPSLGAFRALGNAFRRSEVHTGPRTWTVAVESARGYGDDARAQWAAAALERRLSEQDPHVGVEPDGAITVVLDVSADSFEQAVARAVRDVVTAVRDAGGEFPVNYERLPEPMAPEG